MKKRITLALALISATAMAQEPVVLTSIKPIQMITQELMIDVGQPEVLLNSNASPHDYALRPSDVKKVASADLVIWFGHDLEPFLDKVVTKQEHVLELSKIDGLPLHEFDEDHADHDGHDHGSHDPHFWLGYQPTQQVAKAITEQLKQLDSDHATQYEANYQRFTQRLATQREQLTERLAPVKNVGYFVFHDAYGYFEQDYGLNHLGHFTVSPDRKPGAKTLIRIRTALADKQAKCVFAEPQFTPAVVESVVRGSSAKVGVLDPIGSDVEVKAGSYFTFIDQMASDFVTCLAQ
ncbi:zinc ABC transporter-binding protein ZnuA [Vibrio sp. N418]|uniref:zinc ABC transporter substrate-binding protein ZnuA n=1 Tax=Vibrio sp. (strain N418) TaxID=701176 RepID=UPI00021BFA1E|nr:zinc ABC transporter substrate-binding protein ZnuA [Vibrio sp. N418]EGU37092.1 zinc ABC transporter-binding protein ZnuA [Vibrio sp. N418]